MEKEINSKLFTNKSTNVIRKILNTGEPIVYLNDIGDIIKIVITLKKIV